MSYQCSATLNKKSSCGSEKCSTKERTLSIVKPDCVGKNTIGGVVNLLEQAGCREKME